MARHESRSRPAPSVNEKSAKSEDWVALHFAVPSPAAAVARVRTGDRGLAAEPAALDEKLLAGSFLVGMERARFMWTFQTPSFDVPVKHFRASRPVPTIRACGLHAFGFHSSNENKVGHR